MLVSSPFFHLFQNGGSILRSVNPRATLEDFIIVFIGDDVFHERGEHGRLCEPFQEALYRLLRTLNVSFQVKAFIAQVVFVMAAAMDENAQECIAQ